MALWQGSVTGYLMIWGNLISTYFFATLLLHASSEGIDIVFERCRVVAARPLLSVSASG